MEPSPAIDSIASELKFDKTSTEPSASTVVDTADNMQARDDDNGTAAQIVEKAPPSMVVESAIESTPPIEQSASDRGQDRVAESAPQSDADSPSSVTPTPDLAESFAKSPAPATAGQPAAPRREDFDSPPALLDPPVNNVVATPSAPASSRAIADGGKRSGAASSKSPPTSIAGNRTSSRRAQSPPTDAPPVATTTPSVATATPSVEAQEPTTAQRLPQASAPAIVRSDLLPRRLEPPVEEPQIEALPSTGANAPPPSDVARRAPPRREVLAEINGERVASDEILPGVEAQLKQRGAGFDPISLAELRQEILAAELRRTIDRKLLCQAARGQTGKSGVVSTSFAGKSAGVSAAEEAKLAEQWLQRAVPVNTTVSAAELEAFQRSHGQRPLEPAAVRCEVYTAPKTHYRDLSEAKSVLEFAQARAAGERPPLPRDADPAAVQRQSYRINSPDAPPGPLADAIFSLPAGGTSKVVEDSRGWHVVRLIERHRLVSTAPSNQQNERLRAAVVAERRRQQEQAYMEQLRRQARVWTAIDSEMR
jgi:hypothetical protein